MAVNDLLSQEEIAALLQSTNDDVVSKDNYSLQDNEETRTNDEINENYPVLEAVNERFASFSQLALSKLLGCNTEITVYGIRSLEFSDYSHSLFIPTSMNIAKIKQTGDIGLFIFDPKLVFMLVDKYFGGAGRPFRINEGREFAPTEIRVIEMILEKLFVTFEDAWSPVTSLKPEFVGSEINPQLTSVIPQKDTVIVIIFHVSIEDSEGDFHIAMPVSAIESLQKQSDNSQ